MPISIYPPTLQSSQPAFLYTQSSYPINFTLQKITSFTSIGHVQIRVVRQSNNRTIVNTSKYPDGIIYKAPDQVLEQNDTKYSIAILATDLAESWQPGSLYKVQMRFGATPMFTSIGEFATWKKQQIDNQTFSEWSTVMIIKAINKPETYIENNSVVNSTEPITSEHIEYILTPLIFGVCKTNIADREIVNKYKFDLYKGDKTLEEFQSGLIDDFIETSGWKQRNATTGSSDSYRFTQILENGNIYTVFYSIETINGYKDIAKPYTFLASEAYLTELKGVSLRVDHEDIYCKENGCINIYLTADNNQKLSGTYIISRTSEKTNYTVWEDLKYLNFFIQEFNETLIYQDFTIESGVHYKYAFQQENAAGLRTAPIQDFLLPHSIDFEYSYIYRDGIQLRLMFNQKVTSFKHATLTSKQDTLGDRYPHLTRNGNAYYAEFPISGLISFQMDIDQTFLQLKNQGYFYKDELIIPRNKFQEQAYNRDPVTGLGTQTNYNNLSINSNLTKDNIFIERKFREKAEEFLNDFTYKLYKSPTEGNIVIVLHNVTLTPNATLGRMLFEFNATAYEVTNNTIDNLNEFGIINIGEFGVSGSEEDFVSFGQVKGLYTPNYKAVDIYNLIKQQEEISIGGGYKLSLQKISNFWVERYPNQESILNREYEDGEMVSEQVRNQKVCTAELIQLNAALAKAKNDEDEELVSELEKQIEQCTKLQQQVSSQWLESTILLSVNGKNIIVSPNRVYQLDYPVSDLQLIASDYPVIINYTCNLKQIEDTSQGVISAVDSSRIWGQVSGVFTDTKDIIQNGYNYNYKEVNISPYRVYSNSNIGVIYDKKGNKLVDNTNYNVYRSLNLYKIIEEDTRKQVELIYDIPDGFIKDEEGYWTSGKVRYEFSGITDFAIEAEPGTVILIGKQEDGNDAIEIKIGASGKYSLSSVSNMIQFIKLKQPSFALIDYKCITTQMRMR